MSVPSFTKDFCTKQKLEALSRNGLQTHKSWGFLSPRKSKGILNTEILELARD
jgi:hypothetical protein